MLINAHTLEDICRTPCRRLLVTHHYYREQGGDAQQPFGNAVQLVSKRSLRHPTVSASRLIPTTEEHDNLRAARISFVISPSLLPTRPFSPPPELCRSIVTASFYIAWLYLFTVLQPGFYSAPPQIQHLRLCSLSLSITNFGG